MPDCDAVAAITNAQEDDGDISGDDKEFANLDKDDTDSDQDSSEIRWARDTTHRQHCHVICCTVVAKTQTTRQQS